MALAITVKEGEVFKVGEALIVFKRYTSNQYRFVIDAPKDVQVFRPDLIPEAQIPITIQSKSEKRREK